MTISRAFRAAGKVYFGKPSDVFRFMLVELCLTAACFSFALFLTMKNGWIPALLCIPAYLLLMLPARVNAAAAMQDSLAGNSVFTLRLADPSLYGKKLGYGLKRGLILLLWGAPLIAGVIFAWIHYAGDTDAFTLLRAIKAFGGGELMRGGLYILAIAVAMILLLLFGIAFCSGDRHAWVLGDKTLMKRHRWKTIGCWFCALVTVLPILAAVVVLIVRYAPSFSDLNTLVTGQAKLPNTRTSLLILGIGMALTVPLMPLRSLVLAAWVRGLKD